jgi:P-type Cu+ transporter
LYLQANLGIAVGAGSHIAVDAADMVIVRNNLFDTVVALDLAKVVFSRIRWNLLWALLYNVMAIPVAAGFTFPFTHAILPPQYAGLCMALSSISVVISSMALKCYRRPSRTVKGHKTSLTKEEGEKKKSGSGATVKDRKAAGGVVSRARG